MPSAELSATAYSIYTILVVEVVASWAECEASVRHGGASRTSSASPVSEIACRMDHFPSTNGCTGLFGGAQSIGLVHCAASVVTQSDW